MENFVSVLQVLWEVFHSRVENMVKRTLPNVEARDDSKNSSILILAINPQRSKLGNGVYFASQTFTKSDKLQIIYSLLFYYFFYNILLSLNEKQQSLTEVFRHIFGLAWFSAFVIGCIRPVWLILRVLWAPLDLLWIFYLVCTQLLSSEQIAVRYFFFRLP